MKQRFLIAALLTAAGFAQQPATPPPAGSIEGTVLDKGTGVPIADVQIAARSGQKTAETTSDAGGRYVLHDVAPGTVLLQAVRRPKSQGSGLIFVRRTVTLAPGQDLKGIDFRVEEQADISGKVVDENREPVPGIYVFLVAREYYLGSLHHVYASVAKTDDEGKYRLGRIMAGRAYLVLAEQHDLKLDAISNAPIDPKFRRRAVVPTYFPNARTIDGAEPLILQPGEHREGIDIRLARAPSLCVDGLLSGPMGSGNLRFNIASRQVTSGASGNGAMYMSEPGGVAGPDGKIRICDLAPGDYQITASERQSSGSMLFGVTPFAIRDEDMHNLRVIAAPGIDVPGEVVWSGEPPEKPETAKLSLMVRPVTRAPFMGESDNMNVRTDIPGTFQLKGLLIDDYSITIRNVPDGTYIKDVTYGGRSILHGSLRPGSAIGNAGLKIVLARDGGTISVRAADSNGKPVGNSYVLLVPADTPSDAALSDTMISGQTDQNGLWTSTSLAPGKYYVMGLRAPEDRTPETLARLWSARTDAQEIELGSNAHQQVTVEPK